MTPKEYNIIKEKIQVWITFAILSLLILSLFNPFPVIFNMIGLLALVGVLER